MVLITFSVYEGLSNAKLHKVFDGATLHRAEPMAEGLHLISFFLLLHHIQQWSTKLEI